MSKKNRPFVFSLNGVALSPLEESDGYFVVFLKNGEGDQEQEVLSRDGVVSLLEKTFGNRCWTRELRKSLNKGVIPEDVKEFFFGLFVAVLYSPEPTSLVAQKRRRKPT